MLDITGEDEWESALAGAMDLAVSKGWKIVRGKTISYSSKRCCAIGAVLAVNDLPSCFSLRGMGLPCGVAMGFENYKVVKDMEVGWRIGHDLAKIFVDGGG